MGEVRKNPAQAQPAQGPGRRTPTPQPPAPNSPDSANPGTPSDETLLTLAGKGDRDAFMRLHQTYAPRIYGLIVTLVGKGPAAEDAFQEAMWEIWRRAASYDPRLGSAPTWMLMLARSRAVDMVRRRSRAAGLTRKIAEREGLTERSFETGGTGPGGSSAPGGNPDSGLGTEEMDTAARSERAAELLARLPVEQATVVRMAFMQGLTREKIADALGVPVGTVKTRLRTAVRALAGAMATREGSDGAARP